MPLNRVLQRQGLQIVHEPSLGAQAPEWSSPQFIRCILRSHLDDPVARSNIMQKEIAERMNDFVAQSFRNREHAPINDRSSRSCGDGLHVASGAADARE